MVTFCVRAEARIGVLARITSMQRLVACVRVQIRQRGHDYYALQEYTVSISDPIPDNLFGQWEHEIETSSFSGTVFGAGVTWEMPPAAREQEIVLTVERAEPLAQAAYSEKISTNYSVNTPERELDLVRSFAPIGLDPCSNPTSTVRAAVEWFGPKPKCQVCGEPASYGPATSTIDRCLSHTDDNRARIPDAVLSDPRFGVDGLAMSLWGAYVGQHEVVFVNPPYGSEIVRWIAKMNLEGTSGIDIIALLPGRFDTRWFRSMQADRVCWYSKRIPFVDHTRPNQKDTAKFPSVFAYYGPRVDWFTAVFQKVGVVTAWGGR